MAKKILIKSFGCQMNEYDSEKIAAIMTHAGEFEVTNDPRKADLIVLNTCSVRAKAEEKVFSELGRLRLIKSQIPKQIIAVGGCVSSHEKERIFQRAPYVDIVFGPQTIHRLPAMYASVCQTKTKSLDVSFPQIEKFDYFPLPKETNSSAYVTIMEGCNKFCSYCIVPYVRGREVSRPFNSVIAEIQQLTDKGAKEIHLLGQNVNAYCDNNKKLADLINAISKIENLARIRFTTSHPAEFGDDLVAIFASERKVVSHLHLPVQSGSDHVLKLMRRGYSAAEYVELINKLRKARPNIHISTDFIVGFPGETIADFDATIALIRDIVFDASFSFCYSPRPLTPAANLTDNVSSAEKKRRLMVLQNVLASQARKFSTAMVGTEQEILVTGLARKTKTQFSGRTENNRVVNFTSERNLIGELVTVKITESLPNCLRGELV